MPEKRKFDEDAANARGETNYSSICTTNIVRQIEPHSLNTHCTEASLARLFLAGYDILSVAPHHH